MYFTYIVYLALDMLLLIGSFMLIMDVNWVNRTRYSEPIIFSKNALIISLQKP